VLSQDAVADSLLEKARASQDDLQARLLLAAAVERIAEAVGARAVVTGGTGVDFYVAGAAGTSEAYPAKWRASADVDVVVLSVPPSWGDKEAVKRALRDMLGFEPLLVGVDADGKVLLGRGFVVPRLGYNVEIVGDELHGDPRGESTFVVEIDGHPVILRGPEDTLLAYAESGWHMRDARDWERALAVCAAMRPMLDLTILLEKAARRKMSGICDLVLRQVPLPATTGALF